MRSLSFLLLLVLCVPGCVRPGAPAPPTDANDDDAGDDDDGQDVGPPRWVDVHTGGQHSCGVTSGDDVLCWGSERYGESSPPQGTALTSVSVGARHTRGITPAGEVLCWGFDSSGQARPPQGTFAQVSAGGAHTCGVTMDGAVLCWGLDSHGQASPPPGIDFTSVSAATYHSCGVTTLGEVVCWGWNEYGQASPPSGLVFTSVSTGHLFSCGVTADGAVTCWGVEGDGQGTPPEGFAFSSVAAGSYHSCGLTTDGEALCWGWGGLGETSPPDGATFTSVSVGGSTTCGLSAAGEVVCWGRDDVGQGIAPDLEDPGTGAQPDPEWTDLVSETVYCEGNDPGLADCDPDRAYDPWIASTGEVNYWIRDGLTLVIPFVATYEPAVEYGYFQLTSPEVGRERETEDIFHIWLSESPDGPVMEGTECEWYSTQATGYVYWTQREEFADEVCDIGDVPRVLYLNAETRCHPTWFEGPCDDDNRQKSNRTYQFDISRRVSWE